MKQFAEKFYNSKQWEQCRESYIVSVNGLCERCLAKGDLVPGKIVHHKIYLSPMNINNPSITLDFNNLEYLCQDCHNKEHHSSSDCAEGLVFDCEGRLVHKINKKY